MIRVLHFAQDGDTSGYFPQLARWHDRTRFQMFFGTLKPIAPWLREYMESQGVECLSCNCRRRLSYPWGSFRLIRFLRNHRIDILHTHLFEPSVVGLAASVVARTPIRIMTRHYSDYHTRIGKSWHVRVDKFCNSLCHAIIAVSQHTADHLIEVEKTPPSKVHTIHNGIDFDRVKLSGTDAWARVRAEFSAYDAHLLVIVARLHPEKGHEHLFRAIAQLKGRTPRRLLLLVAGTGTFLQSYRQLVCSLDCEDNVKFVGFRKDVPDLMAAADIVVLPSLAEAFGLVLTEALYLGTPVVATRVGGIPEIVKDGEDGILVPPGDSRALVEALSSLLNDPDKRIKLVSQARNRIRERFCFDQMLRSYEAVYESLACRSPRIPHYLPTISGGTLDRTGGDPALRGR